MKLQNELQGVIVKLESIKEPIKEYAEKLKIKGGYKDFETRLAWDALTTVCGTTEICQWYELYNCTDEHITTLAKKALKAVYKI